MEGEKIEKGDIATARDGETQSSQKNEEMGQESEDGSEVLIVPPLVSGNCHKKMRAIW
jgi:hypothetical protein